MQCETNWILKNNNCYYVSDNLVSYDSASTLCQTQNAYLAGFTNDDEYNYLRSMKWYSDYWVNQKLEKKFVKFKKINILILFTLKF